MDADKDEYYWGICHCIEVANQCVEIGRVLRDRDCGRIVRPPLLNEEAMNERCGLQGQLGINVDAVAFHGGEPDQGTE